MREEIQMEEMRKIQKAKMRAELLGTTNLEGGILLEENESMLSTNYDEVFRKPLLALTNGVCFRLTFCFLRRNLLCFS